MHTVGNLVSAGTGFIL